MNVGMGPGSATMDLVRSAIGTHAIDEQAQVAVTRKTLDVMKVAGEAAVQLIEAAGLGQHVNVRA